MWQIVYKLLILLAIGIVSFSALEYSYAQEPQLATFQETGQIIIDQQISNNVTASISLQTTSNQEIRIPAELEKHIHDIDEVVSVIVTNENQCVLGVIDETCIMVNISRENIEGGIFAIQDRAKEIGDSLIDEINEAFDINAEHHSTYIHHKDEVNKALETSGAVSGRGIVSAVYTVPKEDTSSMYEKFSAILLPKVIRDAGGFYDISNNLAADSDSRMTLSIIPMDNISLFQLKVSLNYPEKASGLSEINPLEFLKTNELKRSDYYSNGFYPLNSLLNIVVLASEPVKVTEVNTNIIPTKLQDGQRFPTDITKQGFVFEQESGQKIDAKFLFGKEFTINENELMFTIVPVGEETADDTPIVINQPEEEPIDESMVIVGIIIAAGIAAAVFYLKGYRKS